MCIAAATHIRLLPPVMCVCVWVFVGVCVGVCICACPMQHMVAPHARSSLWLLLLLGAAHGCSSCMLGANTITEDPMQLGMPMIPSTWYQSICYQYPHFLKKTHHYATPPQANPEHAHYKHLKYMANPLQYKSIWQSRRSVSQSHHDTDQQSC